MMVNWFELLTWAEARTVETKGHPHVWPDWNFTEAFPALPFVYRRSVIKDAIGKVKSYLSNRCNWQQSGKKKGKPGVPGSRNHPTLYEGTFSLELSGTDFQQNFVRLKVYTAAQWIWAVGDSVGKTSRRVTTSIAKSRRRSRIP